MVDMFLMLRTSVVGSEWRAKRHRNTHIFDGTFILHRFVQSSSSLLPVEEPLLPSCQFSLAIFVLTMNLYAELTVKRPFLSGCHAQRTSMFLVHIGIFMIASASVGRKTDVISAESHDAVAGSSSSETNSSGFWTIETTGCRDDSLGIQLCSQIFVLRPLPILRINPCLRMSLPSSKARQICDGREPSLALRNEFQGNKRPSGFLRSKK